MATLFELLSNGQLIENKPIVEPLNASPALIERLKDFFPEEVYNLTENSLLYKFMLAIMGDSGIGGIKKALLYPRISSTLMGSQFNDLDALFASPLSFPRLNDEIYTADPTHEMLTQEQWAEVRRKDSWYKARCLDYMRAIQFGNAPPGMKLAAKAATGIESEIFERWMYLDDIISDEPIGIPNIGQTSSRDEFTVRMKTSNLSIQDHRRLMVAIDRLKPANSFVSVEAGGSNLIEIPIGTAVSSSDYFIMKRMVTGNDLTTYPDASANYNTWIESSVEKEAPTLAFSDRSENITYPTIEAASASSYHIGPFNYQQRTLFPYLKDIPSRVYAFTPDNAFPNIPVNYEIVSPWVIRNEQATLAVNNHYPVGYFADDKIATIEANKKIFWSSAEDRPDIPEEIEFDFQSSRPINMVEFEIGMKPIDIGIQYQDSNLEWQPVTFKTNIENNTSVFYVPSANYNWQPVELNFETVTTNKIKLILTRRPDPFPFNTSDLFEWSVDVRNFKAGYIVASELDFVVDEGTDILGNPFVTQSFTYSASQVTDGNLDTFWQSQANPSRLAVEALYFDISQAGLPSTIDEIWVDPVTHGCLMHIYYSDDSEEADWDFKLWSPVPRHYTLIKGNIQLPNPITCKYIKLEFTKLPAFPYPTLYKKSLPPIRFRLHPTWVVEYIQSLNTEKEKKAENVNKYVEVQNTPEVLGIKNPTVTKLTDERVLSIQDFIQENLQSTILGEYQIWKVENKVIGDNQSTINYFPDNIWRENLLKTIKQMDAQTDFLFKDEKTSNDIFKQEKPLSPKAIFNLSSRSDTEDLEIKKVYPDTWFPRRCRHGYKVVESSREFKLAYYVGIREVKFFKRNQSSQFDDRSYFETLADNSNISSNSFVQRDWRYMVSYEAGAVAGGQEVPQYGFENFDTITFAD